MDKVLTPVEETEEEVFVADRNAMMKMKTAESPFKPVFMYDVAEGRPKTAYNAYVPKAEDDDSFLGRIKRDILDNLVDNPVNMAESTLKGVARGVTEGIPNFAANLYKEGVDLAASAYNAPLKLLIANEEKVLAGLMHADNAETPEGKEAVRRSAQKIADWENAARANDEYADSINLAVSNIQKQWSETLDGISALKRDEADNALFYDLGSGATSLAGAVGLAFFTKNPMAAAKAFGLGAQSSFYNEMRSNGSSVSEALAFSLPHGAAQAALERVGVHVFVENMAVRSMGSAILRNTFSEAVQEASQQGAEGLVRAAAKGMTGADVEAPESVSSFLYDCVYAGVLGAAVSVPVSAGGALGARRRARGAAQEMERAGMDADDAMAQAGYLVYNDRVGELSHALSEAKATENFDRALAVFTQYAEIVENKTGKNFWSKLDAERKTEFLQSLIVSPQKYVADAAQIANDMTDPDTFDDPTPEGIAKNFAETLENYTANAEESINGVLDRRLEAITQAEEKTKRQRAVLDERQDLSSTDKKVIGDMLEAFNVSVADKFGADEITEISVKTKTPEVDPIRQDEFTERAAFYEYEQGLTRAESERLAMRDVFGEERSEADAFVDTYKSAQIYDDIPFFQRGENESLLKIDSAKEMNGLDSEAFSKKMLEMLYSFRNRRIPNASIGGEIQIRASSIRKYKSFFADENKRLIVPYIPELLEKAEFTKEKSYAQEKEKNIVSYWKSNIPVNIDGQNYDIHLTVKQDDKGNLFWDAQVKEKARRTVSATNRSVGGLSVEDSTLNMDIIPSSERKSNLLYQNAYDEYVRDFEFDDTGFMKEIAALSQKPNKKKTAELRQKYGTDSKTVREAYEYVEGLRKRRALRNATPSSETTADRLNARREQEAKDRAYREAHPEFFPKELSEEEMQKGREEAAVSLSEDVLSAMSESERATYERDYARANLRERRAITASANLEYFTKVVLPEMQKAQEVKNVKKSDISGSLYIDGARVSDHSLPGKYNGDDGVILSGVMSAEDMRAAVLQEIEDAAARNNDRKQRELFYQRAYAGSRVDYDRPSLEAIGSGEGHQAHGWGLYYALNRDVAEKYRRSFAAFALDYEGKEIKQKAADIYIDGKKVDNESALGLAISAKTHRTNKEALEYIRVLRRMNLKRLNQARSESDEDGVRTYEGILS